MRSSRRARVSGGVSEQATDISFYIREFNFWNFELSSRRLSRLLSFWPILTFEFLAYLDFWVSRLSWLLSFSPILTFDYWLLTFDFRPHRSFRAYKNLFYIAYKGRLLNGHFHDFFFLACAAYFILFIHLLFYCICFCFVFFISKVYQFHSSFYSLCFGEHIAIILKK